MDTAFARAPAARLTLPQVLKFDAFTCAAFGVLLVSAAAPLAPLLGLSQALLFWSGVVLFPSATLMMVTARKPVPALVWTVILGNAAWVLASLAVMFASEATAFGVVFVLGQAIAVLILTSLELKTR